MPLRQIRQIGSIFYQTYNEWNEDNAWRLSAALAFYTIFSLAPILLILVAIIGLIFGQDAAQGRLQDALQQYVGPQSAGALQGIMAASAQASAGTIATIVGFIIILIGATGVFVELQSALNSLWEVRPRPDRGYLAALWDRLNGFLMLLGVGLILLLSLAASMAIALASQYIGGGLPGGNTLWIVLNWAISLLILSLMFALLFKYVPDVEIAWSDVWVGAVFTAVLFTIGKWLLGWYLGSSSIASAYGAAGSIIIFLVWVYYSMLIMFFGAEFTQVYSNRMGSHVRAAENALPATEAARARQELPRREGTARTEQREAPSQPEAGKSQPPRDRSGRQR